MKSHTEVEGMEETRVCRSSNRSVDPFIFAKRKEKKPWKLIFK